MAYTNGTATNYKDLLAALATFAAANGWTILEQSTTVLYLRGEGSEGLDEIYAGIEAFENTASNRYNWRLVGSWGWRSGRAITNHPVPSGNTAFAYLWNASIPYWMVATPRRIILVAKVGTIFQTVYLGFGLPVGTDAQYPYPLIIGGCGSIEAQSYSASGNGHSAFWANNGVSGMLSRPGGDWSPIGPYADVNTRRAMAISIDYESKASILNGPGEAYALDQIYLADTLFPSTYVALDGIYRVSGHNNTAENIIPVGSVNYLVVPDVYRVGNGDYCALRLT